MAAGVCPPSRENVEFGNVVYVKAMRPGSDLGGSGGCKGDKQEDEDAHNRQSRSSAAKRKSHSGDVACTAPFVVRPSDLEYALPMSSPLDSVDLTGKLLIAMPGMGDPRFEKSVVYMCAHSAQGAMGLIVNKPAPGIKMDDLLEQLDIPRGDGSRDVRVHFGGPVEHGRGFVLHTSDYEMEEQTLKVDAEFGMTATLDILQDMARGSGPERRILALGYSGWGPGQLEGELHRNGWLTCDATPDIVFQVDDEAKWIAALKSLGIDPLLLSSEAGHA